MVILMVKITLPASFPKDEMRRWTFLLVMAALGLASASSSGEAGLKRNNSPGLIDNSGFNPAQNTGLKAEALFIQMSNQ